MNDQTIEQLEERIRQAGSLREETRVELLAMLEVLRLEMNALGQTHEEQAQSIRRFTELSTHESLRAVPDPQLRDLSLQGLAVSVGGFEKSHPKLVQVVNSIATSLSNLGI